MKKPAQLAPKRVFGIIKTKTALAAFLKRPQAEVQIGASKLYQDMLSCATLILSEGCFGCSYEWFPKLNSRLRPESRTSQEANYLVTDFGFRPKTALPAS